MQTTSSHPVTTLLQRWSAGDQSALAELTPIVYRELRILAENHLRRERASHTLQATALIHEAWLRLAHQEQSFENRKQFYGVAAHLMRIILVDHARAHRAAKRGGGAVKVSIDRLNLQVEQRGVDLLALDHALERLGQMDERKKNVIVFRYFGGMKIEEAAEVLGVSEATIRRELRFAENWLYRELSKT